ncbi:PAP2 superfamily protein [bacterium A37T11]|nr:PAP2 superfamily protein [bacterium A37T11]
MISKISKLGCLCFILTLPRMALSQRADSAYTQKISSFIIPTVFLSYGLVSLGRHNFIRSLDLTTKDELQEDHPIFAMHADNYMQYAPAVAVYALNFAGLKGRHSLADATGIYLITEGIMGGTVYGLKKDVHRLRPDHSAYTSFPSGHTANAFASAEFLYQEYKDISPWYGYAGYTVATATGVLRLYNNRHWISDVVAGAGFGILSAKAAYFIYPKLKKWIMGGGKQQYSLVPTYQLHTYGFAFNETF